MKILLAIVLYLIFLLLAAIHFYWGFNGKNGFASSIPTNEHNKPIIHPGPTDCFLIGIVFLSFSVFILIKTGLIFLRLPFGLRNYGLLIIAAVFILRAIGEFRYIGFLKKIKTTRFGQMDSKYYSPLCLVIGILCVVLERLH